MSIRLGLGLGLQYSCRGRCGGSQESATIESPTVDILLVGGGGGGGGGNYTTTPMEGRPGGDGIVIIRMEAAK